MKKICFLIALMLIFSACEAEIEVNEQKENDVVIEESAPKEEEKPMSTEEDALSTKIGQEKQAEESLSTEEETRWPGEDEEPEIGDMAAIYTEFYDSEPVLLSEKQKELVEKLVQPEKWKEVPKDWEGRGCVDKPSNILTGKKVGTIYFSPEGENTLVMVKWGKDQMYQKYYHAPKEVAYDIEKFREKLAFSAESFEMNPKAAEELKEYEDKYIHGFAYIPYYKNFDEENYIDEINTYHLLGGAYYKFNGDYLENDPEAEDFIYPEEFVADYIQKYFLWDTDDMRRNAGKYEFDPETETYYFTGGYGGGYYSPRIVEVRQSGNILELDMEQYEARDEIYGSDFHLQRFNTVKIRIDGDGTWKFLENKVYFIS